MLNSNHNLRNISDIVKLIALVHIVINIRSYQHGLSYRHCLGRENSVLPENY
jgi:hypothetical protein